MPYNFMPYARATQAHSLQVAEALRAFGHEVWRDDAIPAHQNFSKMIEERMSTVEVVLVLW